MRKLIKKFKAKLSGTKQPDLPPELKESKVFCILPWVHLHALPGGEIVPCCKSAHEKNASIGNLNKGDTLSKAWNSENMKHIRKSMLQNKKVGICRLCYEEEKRGQFSMRNSSNDIFKHHVSRLKKTGKTGEIPFENIPFLDIRFSNLCNLRCRICKHEYSSSWYKEAKLLNPDYNAPRIIRVSKNVEELWNQLEPHMEELERVQFAGGEPMIMEEHFLILKELERKKKFNVHITYNTNLTVRYFKNVDIFKIWNKFSNILVMASLDAMGDRGEYLRKDMNWEETEKLRREMIEICPNVKFRIDPTVSIHNVLHLPDFYENWLEKGLIGSEGVRLNLLYGPKEYCITNMPNQLKKKVKIKYEGFLKRHISNPQIQSEFNAVLEFMFSENLNQEYNFKTFTKKIDHLRDENFTDTFPELKELME